MGVTLVDCPKCGKEVFLGPMVEIMEIGIPEPTVCGVGRQFSVTCPVCGPSFYDKPGHHGTIAEKRMTELFPRDTRRRLRNVLSPDDRKRFKGALAGTREPKDSDIKRWLDIQSRFTV